MPDPTTRPGKPPEVDTNPLNPSGPSIDRLVQEGINEDLWNDMKGDLPCADASERCIAQLQGLAASKNPLLRKLDESIKEIEDKIAEARKQNRRSVWIGAFTPAVQLIFQGTGATSTTSITTGNTTVTTQTRAPGPLDRVLGIFTSLTGLNNLLSVVGVPLFQAITGTTPGQQQNNIQLTELATRVAALQKDRQLLANDVRNRVFTEVINFDNAAREFQIANEVARRESDRFQLINLEYRLGQHDTNSYTNALNSLDGKKAASFRAWASLRRQLSIIKVLVLGEES